MAGLGEKRSGVVLLALAELLVVRLDLGGARGDHVLDAAHEAVHVFYVGHQQALRAVEFTVRGVRRVKNQIAFQGPPRGEGLSRTWSWHTLRAQRFMNSW